MPRVAIGKAYTSTSRLAGGQRRVNLYVEKNQPSAPTEETLYPAPGLTPKGMPPTVGHGRCLYVATNGDLYAILDQIVYYIDPGFVFNPLGVLASGRTNPAYMADNGKTILVVDGSPTGSQINMTTRIMSPIADPNFLGADRISFINYFLVMNQPGTSNWYSTEAATTIFNALFFGTLTEWAGNCIGLIASEAAVWLFNSQKGEVWQNAGTSPFAFQPLSGVILENGLAGPYALGRYDVNVYWVSQSPEGGRVAMSGVSNACQRISTHAVEAEWLNYQTVSDCIVQTYQIRGHPFVLFHFPTADRTWCYDVGTDSWHEEAFYDINGVQHRTKDTFMAYAYGRNFSLDWATGALYERDEENFSLAGDSQIYITDFPHILDQELNRFTVWRVIADMISEDAVGLSVPIVLSPWSAGFNPGFGPNTVSNPPFVTLLISRDRGKSFFAHSDQLLAGPYGYNTKPTFNRCGVAYDAVLRFQWMGPFKTAMNPPFAVLEEHEGDT